MTKHIKIRTSTFETNSSSTHAYTVRTGRVAKPTFKPIITETINAYTGMSSDDDWKPKLASLAGYLYLQGREAEIENLQDIFYRFTGTEPSFDFTRIKESMEHPKYPLTVEYFFEEFNPRGPYGDEYGNEPEELKEFFESMLKDEDKILAFVCSSGWIDVNEYYDG